MATKSARLNRALHVLEVVAVAVSDISPTTGVFLMIPVVLASTGTGSFVVLLVAGFIALSVALTMAELGAIYPISGGIYSIIRNVLGRPIGFIALIAYLGEGIFIPSVVALGSATYITSVFPGLNVNVVGLIVMLLSTGIAVMNITTSAKFTTFLLVLELLVVGIFTITAFFHPHQPFSTIVTMQKLGNHHQLIHVTPGEIFTAVTVALLSFNGYDSAINFSEETAGNPDNVGRSVFRSAFIGFLAQIIPLVAMLISAKNIPALLGSSSPVTMIGQSAIGKGATVFLNLGAAVAMFACTIAVVLQFSRVLYSSGRDHVWPSMVSKWFSTLHPRFQTPWISTLILGLLGAVFCFFSNLGNLISFTSVLVVCLYSLVAISSFVVKWKNPRLEKPYRIPFGPVAPAIALIGAIAALTQQTSKDLITVGFIALAALIYYLVYVTSSPE